ncbi:Ubiquitin-specific-processing protease 34 [Hyphodiscus hymeniophilus]|uniref:Ubiquitin-specific-processing protease 34 n=1 Tax=Hyphodiscus hymeniophilus TaxID=353542 RepID=A0A9P6VGM7_9HELO|nr:Ubiquitin-specific-processing protease 34 [Hyphodiscus hymeniophilus]
MDHEPAELLRERAVSSEPCSTRPNPFNDNDHTSRKRQRLSRGGSRSRSVDTVRTSDISDSMPLQEEPTDMPTGSPSPPPITPPPKALGHLPTEPTSSRVTINLRTNKPSDLIPSSPPSPHTPTKMNGAEDNRSGLSVETESDALSTFPAIETPSSSPSAISSSPHIEVVTEDDFRSQSPPVAIIGEDEIYIDPMRTFPYGQDGESLVSTLERVAHFFQYDAIDEEKCFVEMRDWIDAYLAYTVNSPDAWRESYIKYREFWLQFPDVIWAFNNRTSRHFGNFMKTSREGRRAFSDLFCQFARLAGRFVASDVRTLSLKHKSDDDEEPEMASRNYLRTLSPLLRKHDHYTSNIGRSLESHYQWDWDGDIAMMVISFQNEGGTLLNLTRLVQGQMSSISRNPKMIVESLVEPSQIAQAIAHQIAATMSAQSFIRSKHTDLAQQQMAQAYEFFRIMSSSLELMVEKYFTFLAPDSALRYIESLFIILRDSLSSDNTATQELVQRRRLEAPQLTDLPRVMSLDWKFTVLKKFITSTQMQLRVVGVTRMCGDLMELYNYSKGSDYSSNPLLLFFADFILNHELIDYLVGTGSHPEIIQESQNIVGFLIVTRTYKRAQSDKIWQTVMTSQDPRVVEAILRMLRHCYHLCDYETLLYLCQKTSSLPIESHTAVARDFCENLVRELIKKYLQERESPQCIDSPPYELCVRLIRQSSIITADCPAGHPDIQSFAALRLRELLMHGPSSAVRDAIYLECIKDITARTSTALGSICVINAVLRQNLSTDLHTLTTEHGLTRLIIEDLRSTMLDKRLSSSPSARESPASQARRDLLLTIIIHEPGTISPDLGAQLWDLLVGRESKGASNRNVSWQILNTAVKKSGPNNVFTASCFRDYLPHLPPDCFTIGALEFAREAISSWLVEVQHDFAEEDKIFDSGALKQLWSMILTAPPNTIDAPAITILVEVYLESQLIMSLPRAIAISIHLALVDRCLKELAAAAIKLKASSGGDTTPKHGSMALVASEVEVLEQTQIFARSLAVLREFLKAYQLKPQFASLRPTKLPILGAQSSVEGEPLTVKYQSFDGGKQTEVKSFTLGKLNNAATFFAKLEKATGFTNYKVYCDGKVFVPEEIEISKSLEELNLNGLVLVHRREDAEGGISEGNKTSLELEITKHFDDLWSYLAMDEKVAQEIYYFLVKFPVYDRLTKEITSESTSYAEIFPSGQPFKSLYAIYALRECVNSQSLKRSLGNEFLTRAVSLIIAAISDPDVINRCPNEELRDCLALQFIDCFVNFLNLKGNPLPTAVTPYLNDALLGRLLEILNGAKSTATTPNSAYVTGQSFEAILDACIHNSKLWLVFESHLSSTDLLRDLILDDPRSAIRKSVMKQIMQKCTSSSSLAKVSPTEFTIAFWPIVLGLIPHAAKLPQNCDETFTLCQQLFKKLADTSINSLDLDELVRQWSKLLLSHTPIESIGHPESLDPVAHGLANLLYWATSFAKGSKKALTTSNIGLDLFRELLFPDLSVGEVDSPRIPLLNTVTRQLVAETIYFLVKDDEEEYRTLLSYSLHLVPYDNKSEVPYSFDPLPFLHERSKAIRSPTGYVGLRNLSNTCYLNSLFTQLFMNVPFREFMLEANVPDGGASQKLLSETQRLFSFMQNSLKRYVDPAILAGSIRTYEEAPIDVSVQMDVDEFYNLLFDRWEGQILSPEAKKKFRSFYGGQLVQQVKSKECSHISERLEPFSAIQCDIKGKTCLQESLQAYVDGEVMEGDNKYKCSTCDRHVDAVKRACLKDIPDNLIFHLKRFDFNLRTLTRSKINDYFSFPPKIDMRPYKVEHLTEGLEEGPEDVFELVGVLVHSGTAESGHYYSYIRERPSNSEKENWIEFNDDIVGAWDPSYMEGNCFGGVDYRGTLDNNNLQYDKSYSAYMLFYQRSSVLARQKQTMEFNGLQSPIRLDVPRMLFNHITLENEVLLRKYCLYDRSHIHFIIKMLGNIRNINKGMCSPEHQLEKIALTTALNHLDQVIARTKDLPEFPDFMLTLEQLCYSCAECSRDFLEWLCDCPEALRHQLLRNPDQLVRSRVARLILATLNKVRVDASYAYGLGDEDGSDDGVEDDAAPPRVLQRVVFAITKLWDMFERNSRAWPEYFGLLAGIANMGDFEGVLLLDMGFLRKTLEIISADRQLPLTTQYERMLNIISKRVATRPVSFDSVIELMYHLLQLCDVSVESIQDDEERLELSDSGSVVPLANTERLLLVQHWTRGNAHILVEKLLHINQNPHTTRNILISLLHWQESLDPYIFAAITRGISKGSSVTPAGPFLQAAALYCEHSEGVRALPNMVTFVAQAAYEPDNHEGREFLQFFKSVFHLQSNQTDMPKSEIEKFCLDKTPQWAPALLLSYETQVRQDTEEFLQDIILQHSTVVDYGLPEAEALKSKTIIVTAQKLGISCLQYLHETFVRQRQQAVKSNLISIHNVIETCATFFDEDNQDTHSPTRSFFHLKSSVLPNLRRMTVDELEEEVSGAVISLSFLTRNTDESIDWEDSEQEYGSSEPMDNLTEQHCAELDTDIQL